MHHQFGQRDLRFFCLSERRQHIVADFPHVLPGKDCGSVDDMTLPVAIQREAADGIFTSLFDRDLENKFRIPISRQCFSWFHEVRPD